jgi:hypothetical protein
MAPKKAEHAAKPHEEEEEEYEEVCRRDSMFKHCFDNSNDSPNGS